MAVALDANGLHLVSVDYETTPTTQTVPRRRKRPEMRMETRTRLLDAAIGLIVAGGVAAASIRGICERAGFSQGAFYSYFASKDDLLFTLVEEHMANLARKFDMLVADTRYQTVEASWIRSVPVWMPCPSTPAIRFWWSNFTCTHVATPRSVLASNRSRSRTSPLSPV